MRGADSVVGLWRGTVEQQMLKQASQRVKLLSAQYNLPVDESVLPDFELKAPVKVD